MNVIVDKKAILHIWNYSLNYWY